MFVCLYIKLRNSKVWNTIGRIYIYNMSALEVHNINISNIQNNNPLNKKHNPF